MSTCMRKRTLKEEHFPKAHLGRIINRYDLDKLLATVYLKTAVAINAVHGFERPGIWRFRL